MKAFIWNGSIAILTFFSTLGLANAQVLDPTWRKGILLIERKVDTTFQAYGTGFLVMLQSIHFVVTNKHVAQTRDLFFRVNLKSSSSSIRISVDTMQAHLKLVWGFSQNADVAAIPLAIYPRLAAFADSLDTSSFGISLFKDWKYPNEGDDVFILGFPLQIGASTHLSPVYRFGIIALKDTPGQFLIDSNIYPGNSGSPVFMRPSIYDYRSGSMGEVIPGYLVGVVSAYLPYSDVAISLQTQRPRVVFEENSGLAVVYSTEAIVTLITDYISKFKLR